MADTDKRLLVRFEADNKGLLRKLEQSQKRIKSFEAASGKSITQATNTIKKQNNRIATSTRKTAMAANDSFGIAKNGVSQLGFQVQDVAVQLQGGQNPLLILGQQGSQVASIFGPGGAVIGALLAVTAALGTALLPKLFDTTNALEKLEIAFKSVDEIIKITDDDVVALSEKFDKLAAQSSILSQSQIKIALQDISEALKDSRKEVLELSESLTPSRLGGRFNRTALLVGSLRAKFEEGKISIEDFSEQLNKLFIEEGSASTELKDVVKSISEISAEASKLRRAEGVLAGGVGSLQTEEEIKLNEKRIETLNDFADADAAANDRRISSLQNSFFAIQDSLRSEERVLEDDFNSKLAIINSFEKRFTDSTQEAEQARLDLKKDFQGKTERLEQARIESSKSFISQSLATIQNGLNQESGLAKAAFAAQKAIAIAEMVVATENAATKALTLGTFAGPIAASAIRGLGYASVGVVAGQAIASFEGGGMTPDGPRSGGMDGKGGMLAMLHPNEKVTDLNRSSANDERPWKIEVNNFNGSQVSQSVNEEKRLVAIMIEQANNQNSEFGLAMQTRYQGMQPRGTR